jgi:hypothetical protein
MKKNTHVLVARSPEIDLDQDGGQMAHKLENLRPSFQLITTWLELFTPKKCSRVAKMEVH